MLSSEHIQNEVLTFTSEPTSYEYNFDRKLQAKIYPYDQSFEKK